MWSWLLYTFLRYPQGGIMVLMVGIIAPPLISQDVRSRAFLLYFSRPLARWQYALGKLATVWFYLADDLRRTGPFALRLGCSALPQCQRGLRHVGLAATNCRGVGGADDSHGFARFVHVVADPGKPLRGVWLVCRMDSWVRSRMS